MVGATYTCPDQPRPPERSRARSRCPAPRTPAPAADRPAPDTRSRAGCTGIGDPSIDSHAPLFELTTIVSGQQVARQREALVGVRDRDALERHHAGLRGLAEATRHTAEQY